MNQEVSEILEAKYDGNQGREKLYRIRQQRRLKGAICKSYLELTDLERKIKLNKLAKTFEFTRSGMMWLHYVETFFYIGISQTTNLIYLAMIFAMFQNKGIFGFFYPIMVFGYALMEPNRPSPGFWRVVRNYTILVLFMKFVWNLSIMADVLDDKTFIYMNSLLKLGIYDYDNLFKLIVYLLPEVLILCLLMLNEIKLKLQGLYFKDEDEVETIEDAIERNLNAGDEEAVEIKRVEKNNMYMERYFTNRNQ